jgi:hypothetical protein
MVAIRLHLAEGMPLKSFACEPELGLSACFAGFPRIHALAMEVPIYQNRLVHCLGIDRNKRVYHIRDIVHLD